MFNIIKGKKKEKEKENVKVGNVVSTPSTGGASIAISNDNKSPSSSNLHHAQGLSDEDLKIQFTQLLYELGVPEQKKNEMLAWSNDKKFMLLSQNKDKMKENEEKMKQKGSLYETPQFYLSLLRENATTQKSMSDLKVSLASNKLSWIDSFLNLGGFDEVLKIFQTFQLKPDKNSNDFSILQDCVNCIKSILNSQAGVKSVMTTSHTFKVLVLCLDLSYPPELRVNVLQLTAALTLLPTVGHSYVLEALENFKVSHREKVRFATIIEGARQVANTPIHFEYLTSFMNLVNSIVNSPADLQVRVALRSEFTSLKLIELIKSGSSKGVYQDLDTQINLFFECLDEDSEEVGSQYKEVNIRSPTEVSLKIDSLLESHPALHHHFISILKGLYTLCSTQSDLGGSLWNILDESVGSILKDPIAMNKESQIDQLQFENQRLKSQLQELETISKLDSISSGVSTPISTASPLLLSTPPPTSTGSNLNIQATQQAAAAQHQKELNDLESKLQQSVGEKRQLESEIKGLNSTVTGLQLKVTKLESDLSSASSSPPSVSSNSTPEPPATGAPPPPPPPPMSGGGGPPPPPPPPGMKKAGAPAAAAVVSNLPTKKISVPTVKMVQLQLKKINNNVIENSMWMNVKDYNLNDQFKNLEELFQVKKPTPSAVATSTSSPSGPSSASKPVVQPTVSILDPKRSQAISIMLSRFKMPLADLGKAITNLDEVKLNLEDAKSLLKFVPTPEEIEILKEEGESAISHMGKPEQFLNELSKINRLTEKLECFIFKQKLSTQIEELTPDINALLKGSMETKDNKSFHQILEIVLSLGNFINGGTNRGEIYGFKLDSLVNLVDVRSPSDPKVTLMTWLIQFLENKHPTLINFYQSFTAIDEAKRVSIQNLRSEVAMLKKGLTQLTNEATASESGPAKTILSGFVGKSTESVTLIEKQFNTAVESFNTVVAFYGEDVKTSSPEEFFNNVSKFKNEFKRTVETIQKSKEDAAKLAARKKSVSPNVTGSPTSTGSKNPMVSGGSGSQLKPAAGVARPVSTNNNNNNNPTITTSSTLADDEDTPAGASMIDQLMNQMRGGQAIKMSRRASQYISLNGSQHANNNAGVLDALNVALKNKK